MRIKEISSFCTLVFAAVLVCGCNGTLGSEPSDSQETEFSFSLTKAGEDNATVSAYLFTGTQVSNLSLPGKEGTYYVSGTNLEPGSVSGGVPAKNSAMGLRASNGGYTLSLVSPVTELSPIGETGKYGIPYSREMETPLFFSTPEIVSLNGIYLNGEYRHSVGILGERRSKIRLTVKCGDNIGEAVIHSVTLNNLLQNSWYLPQTGVFFHGAADTETYISLPTDISSGALESGESVTASDIYAIAQDYSLQDEYGQFVNSPPRILLELGESGDIPVDIPLADNFPDMNTLHYTVTVKSTIVYVSLDLLPWDPVEAEGDIDLPPQTQENITKESWYPISTAPGEGVIE